VVVSKILVLPLAPVISNGTDTEARSGLASELLNSLDGVGDEVLQQGANNVLLEGRQVLGDLAVHLVVLLPQL